jgi:hypothetical protein
MEMKGAPVVAVNSSGVKGADDTTDASPEDTSAGNEIAAKVADDESATAAAEGSELASVVGVVRWSFSLLAVGLSCVAFAVQHRWRTQPAVVEAVSWATLAPTVSERVSRSLRHKAMPPPPFDITKMGSNHVVFNRSVFGAIIMSDYARMHGPDVPRDLPPESTEIRTASVNASAAEVAAVRSHNARVVVAQLPFPVIHWPPVMTQPCPHGQGKSKSERGQLWAHLQIWMDFVFFDRDVILALGRKEVKGMYHSTSYSSRAGAFSAAENGTLYKNGLPFYDEDILVVFEDDLDIAPGVDVNATLKAEFTAMNTDVLYLGHCEEKAGKLVGKCSHAYAVTRAGCRKLVKGVRTCGTSLDDQLASLANRKVITHRTMGAAGHQAIVGQSGGVEAGAGTGTAGGAGAGADAGGGATAVPAGAKKKGIFRHKKTHQRIDWHGPGN